MAKIKVLLEASAKDRSVRKWLREATKHADEFTAASDRAKTSLTQLGKAGASMGPIGAAGGMPGAGGAGRGRGPARARGGRGSVPTVDRALANAQRSRASAAQRENKLVDRRISAMAKAGQQEARTDKRRLRAAERAARNIENLSDAQVEEIETQREINSRRKRAARSSAKGKLGPDATPRAGGAHRRFEMAENLAVAGGEFDQVADRIEQGVTASLTSFRDFEKGVVEVSTLTDNISVDEIEKITKGAAAQFGGLPTDQVKAFYAIVSAGATDAASAQSQLTAANKLAIGGVATQEEAVLAISKSVANFGTQLEDTARKQAEAAGVGFNKDEFDASARASDILFASVQKGQNTVSELARAIPQTANAAATLGLTMEETAAAVSFLSTKMPTASEAANGLKQAISNIQKPSKAARKEARRLGIDFSAAGIRAAGGLEAWVLKLRSSEKFSETSLAKLFKSSQARDAIGGIANDLEGFDKVLKATSDTAPVAERAYKKMAETSAQKTERLTAKMELLKIQAGEALVPAFEQLAESAEFYGGILGKLITDNPRTAKTVAVLAVGALGLAKAISGVTTAMSLYNTVAGLSATRTVATSAAMTAGATSATSYGKAAAGATKSIGIVPGVAGLAVVSILALNVTLDQAAKGLGILEDGIGKVVEEQQNISFKTPEGEEKSEGTLERERLNRQIAIVNAARQAESAGRKGGATEDSNVFELAIAGPAMLLNKVSGVQEELGLQRERAESDLARLAEEQAGRGILSASEAASFQAPEEGLGATLGALQALVAATQENTAAITSPPNATGPSMEAGGLA